MTISITTLWLLTGVLMLIAEALGISGVGLLFAGLGAITVGTFLNLGLIAPEASLLQFVAFFLSTAVWTAVLWKPMRRFYSNKSQGGYQNMIGETAYIGSGGLAKGQVGEATWSGTIMKAKLTDASPKDFLEAGAQATIVEVVGATLVVKPK